MSLVAFFTDPTERLLDALGKDARERAIDHVYRCGCRNRRLRYHAVVAVGKDWGDGRISTEGAADRLYSLYAAAEERSRTKTDAADRKEPDGEPPPSHP